MKILYLHQYYKTPKEGGAIRSFHIAKALGDQGFKVDVITSTNTTQENTSTGNVSVHYLHVSYNNSFSFFRRIWSFLKFIFLSIYKSIQLKNHKLIYATSTPLTIAIPCLIISYLKGIPYVFEVRDLWPGVPQELGIIKNKFLLKILYKLEYIVYLKSKNIVVLSTGMMDDILHRYPEFKCKIVVVPNFSDNEFSISFNKSYDTDSSIRICYTGTLGFANEVEQFLKLASLANENFSGKFKFTIVGEGSESNYLKSIATANVYFLETMDKVSVLKHIAESHFSYISYRNNNQLLSTGSPNKFFDSLAVGTPTIINFKGWIFDLLQNEELLLFHDINNSEIILEKLLTLCESKSKYEFYYTKSKSLALNNFDKQNSANMIIQILNNIN